MQNCTRHAFTDGQCIHSGCVNCPGRAEERYHQRVIYLEQVSRADRYKLAIFPIAGIALAVLAMVCFVAPERFDAVVASYQEAAR